MEERHSKFQTSNNDEIGYDLKVKKKAQTDIGMFKGHRSHTAQHDSAKIQSVANKTLLLKCQNTINKNKDKAKKTCSCLCHWL